MQHQGTKALEYICGTASYHDCNKQTTLAILGCKKRDFAASELSQISFDKSKCKIHIAVFQ
jgi:hypothetical protein